MKPYSEGLRAGQVVAISFISIGYGLSSQEASLLELSDCLQRILELDAGALGVYEGPSHPFPVPKASTEFMYPRVDQYWEPFEIWAEEYPLVLDLMFKGPLRPEKARIQIA